MVTSSLMFLSCELRDALKYNIFRGRADTDRRDTASQYKET